MKFSGPTRTIEDETHAFTVPVAWSALGAGLNGPIRWLKINPGYGPMDVVEHELTFLQVPAQAELRPSVEMGLPQIDALFPGFARKGVTWLDGPGGAIARIDYAGQIVNAFGARQVVGVCGVTLRRTSLLSFVLVSDGRAAGALDADALAALDSARLKEIDPAAAARALVGQWVIPSKSGASLETMTFHADGTYVYHFETSHTGALRNTYGETTATWGTAAQDDDAGSWEIRDDYLRMVGRKGEQLLPYRVYHDGKRLCLQLGNAGYVR